jgi:hypothetical protein
MQKVRVKKNNDSFDKNKGVFLYDNKQDEMLCNVLELYPDMKTNLFKGEKGGEKKKALRKKVRDAFDKMQEAEQFAYASGDSVFKKKFRGALRKVGRGIATAALAPGRGAAIALIKLNFRGSASRLELLNEKGIKRVEDKWYRLGGNPLSLKLAISIGEKKKPLMCGKKCRARAGKNPQLPNDAKSDFVYAVEPISDAGVASLITAGGGVVASLVKVVGDKSNIKSQIKLAQVNQEIANAERAEDAVDATMTPQERKIADEIIKAQDSGADPIIAIQNNPNLTADEKAEAIRQIREGLDSDDKKKKIIVAIAILGIAGALAYFLTKKSE